jgi:methyl-accepting chemotaxis protein
MSTTGTRAELAGRLSRLQPQEPGEPAPAVCFRCGGDKPGPLAPCGQCGAIPRTDDDLSLSLILCQQLSPAAQLAQFAQQIRSGHGLQISESLRAKVREALGHPQLAAMLRAGRRMGQLADTVAAGGNGAAAGELAPAAAAPPPGKETSLHRNAFWLLGATTRDNRRRLVELAEEKALEREAEACQKARSDLTTPRKRLGAEVAWLPGVSPGRAWQLMEILSRDPLSIRKEAGLPPLAQANLMAASLEAAEAQEDTEGIAEFIVDVARLVDDVAAEDVMRDVNEDRAIAGFPEISSIDEVEAALAERARYYRDAVKGALERLPTPALVDVMTQVLEETTCGGEEHAPALIDLLVDSYEIETQGFLEKEAESAQKLIEAARDVAPQGEDALGRLIDQIETVARNWDKVAQPIQLGFKARGTGHAASLELAHAIRSLGVDLCNEHDMTAPAQRLTALLQELFAELPEFVEQTEEDAEALGDLLRRKEELEAHREEWEREITYSAEVGVLSKTRLSISPQGVSWGKIAFPLEAITRMRWGGIRHSVNGIPTGTTYTIAFGDDRAEAIVELRREEVFGNFVSKLAMAVGPRLLTELLRTLMAGKEVRFAEAIIRDDGPTLPKHKFWGGNENVRCTWNDVQVWSADGAFYIGAKHDKKVYAGLSYIYCANAHLLERAIRVAFEKPGMRVLSDLLGG